MSAIYHRPNPEDVLRRVEADADRGKRGRLKVFLGYASRVGKSRRMFEEGLRRKQRGQDVVVGAIQPVVPDDVREIVNNLEIVPMVGGGVDLPAIVARHPAVCVIDGLANENPPGSVHAHRWEDARDLLERGITVITAVNVQHIQREQVPRTFLTEADEIEVVDSPTQDERLAELREAALLLAADVVDRQLLHYLDTHGLAPKWGAQERILLCLTPHSDPEMTRSGRRNARRFHGALLAAYVEQRGLSLEDRKRLESRVAEARAGGAEIYKLPSGDFVDAVLQLVREHRVTQVFIGHSLRGRSWFRRSPIDRLIDAADGFDLRVFPHREQP